MDREKKVANQKLKISIVGMSPAIVQKSVRLKGIPLAPMALKAYVDGRLNGDLRDHIDIKVKTFFVEEEAPKDIAFQILADKPNIVAFSVYIWNYRETMECARIIKETDAGIFIICGGPQVSPIAREVMAEHPSIDVIPYIQIPGEVVFYQFIKAFLKEKSLDVVGGIIYRAEDSSLIKTAPLTEDLDYSQSPSPYLNHSLSLTPGEAHTVVLENFRGCPMDCGYCLWGCGMNKIKYFPLERLLREIEVVYNDPDIKHVFHSESDALISHERIEIIAKHILKQNSSAQSNFNVNILNLNENLAKLLVKLPKYYFCFGIQTVNPNALKYIGRLRPSIDIFREKFKAFRSWMSNTEYCIDIMLGLPGDDFCGFKMTLDTCLSFRPTRLRTFYPIFLLPGTRFFEYRKELGLRHNPTPPFCVIETETFPRKDIEAAFRLAFWTEIFIYYYPAIAHFFYRVCASGSSGAWINRVEKWIVAIERNVDLFGSCPNVIDVATGGSTQEWNDLKGRLLREASGAENAYQIYHTIQQQEEAADSDSMQKTIALGAKVFDYLRSQGIDTVKFSQFDKLPNNLVKGYRRDEIKSLFSRYR